MLRLRLLPRQRRRLPKGLDHPLVLRRWAVQERQRPPLADAASRLSMALKSTLAPANSALSGARSAGSKRYNALRCNPAASPRCGPEGRQSG